MKLEPVAMPTGRLTIQQHADAAAFKSLNNKFKVDKRIKMNIHSMKKTKIESKGDFVHRVDKETLKIKLPEELKSTNSSGRY